MQTRLLFLNWRDSVSEQVSQRLTFTVFVYGELQEAEASAHPLGTWFQTNIYDDSDFSTAVDRYISCP